MNEVPWRAACVRWLGERKRAQRVARFASCSHGQGPEWRQYHATATPCIQSTWQAMAVTWAEHVRTTLTGGRCGTCMLVIRHWFLSQDIMIITTCLCHGLHFHLNWMGSLAARWHAWYTIDGRSWLPDRRRRHTWRNAMCMQNVQRIHLCAYMSTVYYFSCVSDLSKEELLNNKLYVRVAAK